jgi:hypothetical protein
MIDEIKEPSPDNIKAAEEILLIRYYLRCLGYNLSAFKRYDMTDKTIRERMLSQLRIEYLFRIKPD